MTPMPFVLFAGLTAALAVLGASPSLAGTEDGAAPVHHDISVRLDPRQRTIDVSDRIAIDGGGELVFRLDRNFVVTAFAIDGRRAAPTRIDGVWRIALGEDGRHEIAIAYKGPLARMPDTAAAPGSAFGPNAAVASPHGSYLPPAAAWHPLIEGRDVAYRMTVEVPTPHKAVAPGRLIGETETADGYRATFLSERAEPGILLIAGPYTIGERRHGETLLRTYFTADIAPLSDAYLKAATAHLGRFQGAIGAYPFSAFHIVSSPLPVGLGYPGLTYIGARVLRLPFIRDTSLGHEILHNWWGGAVAIDYDSGNWAEGLTTYMADYAQAGLRSGDAAKRLRMEWLGDYAALPAVRDRPVTDFVSRHHDAQQIIGYNKVAFIFHMLRGDIGAAAFDQGIRTFWLDNRFKTAGWDDLRRAFEAAANKDLKRFFGQWLERSGAPSLRLEAVETHDRALTFTIAQSNLPYALNVPLTVATEAGEETFVAAIDGPATRIEIALSARPLGLTVDPGFDIFRRLDPSETPPILRDVTLDGETVAYFPDVSGADGENSAAAETARQLAHRLMDGPFRPGALERPLHDRPILIIGTNGAVASFLGAHGLPGIPEALQGKGTARVWTRRRDGGAAKPIPYLVVAADDAAAIGDLMRPLPHYRRKSFLVFVGAKAVEHGLWPVVGGPLDIRFDAR